MQIADHLRNWRDVIGRLALTRPWNRGNILAGKPRDCVPLGWRRVSRVSRVTGIPVPLLSRQSRHPDIPISPISPIRPIRPNSLSRIGKSTFSDSWSQYLYVSSFHSLRNRWVRISKYNDEDCELFGDSQHSSWIWGSRVKYYNLFASSSSVIRKYWKEVLIPYSEQIIIHELTFAIPTFLRFSSQTLLFSTKVWSDFFCSHFPISQSISISFHIAFAFFEDRNPATNKKS